MVYCGKPSGACERCRGRRLKCDQGVPSCSACLRAIVDCPGYRDPLALAFRDQSTQVIRKSRRPAYRKRSVVTVTNETAGPKSPAVSPTKQVLIYPPQELAKAYLFVNYIAEGPRGGHMSFLLPLVQDPRNSTVIAAMTAVGLAALSTLRWSPQLMSKARSQYTTALSQTNHALKDPAMSKRDEILAAVVLLGMFEVMICDDRSFIDRWMNHLDGAAKLIEIRGPDQLSRREGLGLFTYLRTQICIGRLYREKYVSPTIEHLTKEAEQYRDPDDRILDQLGIVIIRLINFFAALKDKTISQPQEIIRNALSFDADLMSVSVAIPPSWSYSITQPPLADAESITRAIWGNSYHIYNNIAASNMWNNYRSARILVHETILNTLHQLIASTDNSAGSEQQHALTKQSYQIARQLVDDICASVPFHLGASIDDSQSWGSEVTDTSSTSELNSAFCSASMAALPWAPISSYACSAAPIVCEAQQHLRNSHTEVGSKSCTRASTPPFEISGAGGITLVWPLLVAANSGVVSGDLREWIINCLNKIGHSMGYSQALAAAQLLQNGSQTRAWLN